MPRQRLLPEANRRRPVPPASIGQQVVTVAVGWDLYERTGDAFALGLVGLAQVAPAMVLMLPAGTLSDRFPRRNLFILEEPTIGLHMADVQRLVDVLQRLVDAGHSVLVIEHNLELIAEADWVIDLGPEGGEAGGRLVVEGTPEQVARNKRSHTGRFLRKLLDT